MNAYKKLLEREDSYALPKRHRHLTGLILRKLLSSSTKAVLNNLQILKSRLERLKLEGIVEDDMNIIQQIIMDDDLEDDIVEDAESVALDTECKVVDSDALQAEINELESLIVKAEQIGTDTKSKELLSGPGARFCTACRNGGLQKKSSSSRSQCELNSILHIFWKTMATVGKVVTFSGTNNTPQANKIYQQWREEYQGSSRITGSAQIDKRSALIDHFKDHAEIMIATEAAAEGGEPAILFATDQLRFTPGIHNALNSVLGVVTDTGKSLMWLLLTSSISETRADQRVLELLTEKFSLFDGVFGASDSVLGSIENGVDFEKKGSSQFMSHAVPPEEIELAF